MPEPIDITNYDGQHADIDAAAAIVSRVCGCPVEHSTAIRAPLEGGYARRRSSLNATAMDALNEAFDQLFHVPDDMDMILSRWFALQKCCTHAGETDPVKHATAAFEMFAELVSMRVWDKEELLEEFWVYSQIR